MNGTKINASKYTPQLPHWSQDLSKWNNQRFRYASPE